MDIACHKCRIASQKSKQSAHKVNSSKSINIIENETEINIKFINVDETPIVQLDILHENKLKLTKTIQKEEWYTNTEKKVIVHEENYMVSFHFKTTEKVNKLTIHCTRDSRYLFLETFNV